MTRHWGALLLGVVVIGSGGCGEDDAAKTKNSSAPAVVPAVPGAPNGADAVVGVRSAPVTAPAVQPSIPAFNIQKLIPEDIEIAAGLDVAVVSDKDTPYSEQLLDQFRPVLTMLDGLGIRSSQIEKLWCGTTRSKGDMIICVQGKNDISSGHLGKALGAADKVEKVGRASVHVFSKVPGFNNAFALVNSRTLLLGRYATVIAALKDPKPGSIRAGIDALGQPNAFFWISGANDDAAKKLHLRGIEELNWFVEGAPKPRGMAVSLTHEYKPGGGGDGGAGGGANNRAGRPPVMPGSGPPGGNAGMPQGGPPGGSGMPGMPPGMPGMPPGMPGMPPGMPGMPPGTPGMQGDGSGGGATEARPIEVRVAWSFNSAAASGLMQREMNAQIKAIEEVRKIATQGSGPNASGPPGGMPPGGSPPGRGGPPGMPGGARQEPSAFEGVARDGLAQQAGPPNGPAMAPPMGPPQAGPAANVTWYQTVLAGPDLRLIYHIPKDETGTVAKLIGRVIAAGGASALDDGLFPGSLPALNAGIQKWENAKGEQLAGMQKVSKHPWAAAWSHYSWMTDLLPYVGYESTHGKFDFSHSWTMPYNLPYAMTVVPIYLNPADPRSVWDGLGPPLGATHFVGMSGIEDGRNVIAADLPRTDPRAGIFGYDKVARLSDITDGKGQTIMMIGSGEIVAGWIAGGGATIRGARRPYFDKDTGFGSRGLPSPGAYVMLADGSARLLSSQIDERVFRALCTIHGAEQIDMEKLELIGQNDN